MTSEEKQDDFLSRTQKVLDTILRFIYRWQIHLAVIAQFSHAIFQLISGQWLGAAISLTMPFIVALIFYKDHKDKARRKREERERELARKLESWGPGGYQIVDAVSVLYKLKTIDYDMYRQVAHHVETRKDQWVVEDDDIL